MLFSNENIDLTSGDEIPAETFHGVCKKSLGNSRTAWSSSPHGHSKGQ
jgi:hypothetical protein